MAQRVGYADQVSGFVVIVPDLTARWVLHAGDVPAVVVEIERQAGIVGYPGQPVGGVGEGEPVAVGVGDGQKTPVFVKG